MKFNSTTIPAVLSSIAIKNGSNPAIVSESGESLFYGELNQQVATTVGELNQYGVSRNDRVAIVLPQSPELAVAFLAISAGATAAPLNHNYKKEDYLFYLKDLEARVLVVLNGDETTAREAANELRIPVLELIPGIVGNGSFNLTGETRELEGQGGFAEEGDIALVLHTSGTTSRPKIVPLTHINLCASARNIVRTVGLEAKDCCLNVMPLFHIHGLVACVLASLFAGGKTICTSGFYADKFSGWLSAFNPSWYSAVPTMHQAILAEIRTERPVSTSLRFIRSSSAALPPPVMESLEKTFSVPVIESYGMTEAAHQMASNPMPPLSRKPGSVGLAAGPEVCILNCSNLQLPIGETGEISISGTNVTPGYVKNPEANRASFTDGWFRTGDQGYFDEEGYLFITGRLKEMINRGGENIAPREIDEALLTHCEVRQAVGFGVPHPSLGEDVAAAVILEESSNLDEASLRAYALEKLPAFKVPSRIIVLDDIPKGPTGKIQRIGLADKLMDSLAVSFKAPTSEMEKLVISTIEEILDVSGVGVNDNFFALGGDSLRAVQVLTRVKEKIDFDLPPMLLFQLPSPALLAEHLEEIIAKQEVDMIALALSDLSPDEQAELLKHELPPKSQV